MDIFQFSGKIGPYLEPVHDEAGLTLNKMIRRDMLVDLRTAIHKAKTTGKTARKDNLMIGTGVEVRTIGVTVGPIRLMSLAH